MAHLGSRVSALLDGRLSPVEEERLWAHVHECHPCRDLVEREGWVKTQLATLSFESTSAPEQLKSSLMGGLTCSGLTPPPFPPASPRSRHRGLVAIGGGAAGAAVVGVLALGAAGTPQVERRAPVTDLQGSSTTSPDPQRNRSGDTTPAALRRSTRPDPTLPDRRFVVREKMVP
jgi:anti-sigma factor RsiW